MSSSKSCRTGTNDICSHNPNRRATRTIAPTTANKVQIPNHSIEDIHRNHEGPKENSTNSETGNPGMNLEIAKSFIYTHVAMNTINNTTRK